MRARKGRGGVELAGLAWAAVAWALGTPAPARAQDAPRYDLLVSSRGTSSVKRFDGETGAYVDDFIAPGAGGLAVTQEVRQGPDGRIYVTGRGNDAILAYDPRTGDFLGAFTTGYLLDEPTKTTFADDGRVYVSQWGQTKSSVAVFDAATGSFIRTATPQLSEPMQHLLEPDGDLLVVSFGSRDVRRFDASGTFRGMATSGKELAGPVNLWRHPDGDLLVLDWQAGTVERFDASTGAFVETFIEGFTNAEGWAIGPDGKLYIADWSEDEVLRFDAGTGEPMGVFAAGGGLSAPNSLLFVERLPDFAVAVPPGTIRVSAGSAASVEVVVTADRGLTFPHAVALSCGGLPAGWSCTFAPAEAHPGAGADTVGLTIRTAASARAPVWPVPGGALPAWPLFVGLLWVVGATLAGRRLPRAVPRARRLAWTLAAALAVRACGGDPASPADPGPQGTTAVVSVTATGDGLVRSATVRVTATVP